MPSLSCFLKHPRIIMMLDFHTCFDVTDERITHVVQHTYTFHMMQDMKLQYFHLIISNFDILVLLLSHELQCMMTFDPLKEIYHICICMSKAFKYLHQNAGSNLLIYIRISIDPLGQPKVTAGRDNCFRTCFPSVPTFQI